MTTRDPYNGPSRKLVLAFDVGTTFSGVSYAILNPGDVPKVLGVNRFPAQENVGGDSKIPTIVYYDSTGAARAFGAEALTPQIIEEADDKGWAKVEWFKLHLRPKSMGSSVDGTKIPALPFRKTVTDVFADFLGYLFRCARTYIIETNALGELLWQSVENSIHFVLTHPNGWAGPQQTRMRRSAITAGLVPDTPDGRSRIQFVTEGEASLHFCVNSGLATEVIKPGNQVIIADAGGGTIDVTSYKFTSVSPLSVEECAVPECKAQGSVFVSRRAHAFLKNHLCESKYGSPEDIDMIAEIFDKTAKRIFKDKNEACYIKFGTPRDKDLKAGIRGGQLKLEGSAVASFFEPSIGSLVQVVQQQASGSKTDSTSVFLVGGFAASPWLFSELQNRLRSCSLALCRPDSHTNKAVADGAISHFLDRLVAERMARTTLGVQANVPYESWNADHQPRSSKVVLSLDNVRRLPDHFSSILPKGTKVSETAEYRHPCCYLSNNPDNFSGMTVQIYSYRGEGPVPHWFDQPGATFAEQCRVSADLSPLVKGVKPDIGRFGIQFFRAEFCVVIRFGETETSAYLLWTENGVEKRGPATVSYEDDFVTEPEPDEEVPEDGPKDDPLKEDEEAKAEVSAGDDWDEI